MSALKDMTGQRFGRLVITGRAGNDNKGRAMWHYVCDCGNTGRARGYSLRGGRVRSCGCLFKDVIGELTRKRCTVNIIAGERFGRLTVISAAGRRKGPPGAMWKCVCDCGVETTVRGAKLRAGEKRSCGCLNTDVMRQKYGKYPMEAYKLSNGHRQSLYLTDAYIRAQLANTHNIKNPTTEEITTKRELIKSKRLIRKLRKEATK